VTRLELPERLKGPWEHVLILTYGLDAIFFENALWRQFGARCRNKIVLADGRRYLDACSGYARSGVVRHLNQRYVAEGIYTPRAAHAKLILLANAEQGRLLVGSGNLGWQGYASGGEMFTEYAYSANDPESLPAFVAVRELVEDLTARGYVTPPARQRLRCLLEYTPWFYQAVKTQARPVRHNLIESFLVQLTTVVAGEPVDELWIAAPFYDQHLVALERLLDTLRPQRTCLLLQSGYTSLNLDALEALRARWPAPLEAYVCEMGEGRPYIHAKLYVLKLRDRAVCLQGSPNLSQVAMLLTVPEGNVELANLLQGARDSYDSLLGALNPRRVHDLASLDVVYQAATPTEFAQLDGWYLTGGEWRDDRLRLHYHGALPDLTGARVLLGEQAFIPSRCRRDAQSVELELPPEAVQALARPVPVTLHWSSKQDVETRSNPVYVCNQAALDAELEIRTDETDVLERVGGLDLLDEEFEQLLAELEAALVIDRHSAWRLVGRSVKIPEDEEDDKALWLRYEEIDYDQLRRHPKIQQYIQRRQRGEQYTRSRLQIILSSISGHFRGMLGGAPGTASRALDELETLEVDEGETEDEIEAKDDEKKRHRQTQGRRLSRILKGFVRRYLRGLRSPDFQELAGFAVLTDNYIIFGHLLWFLFSREWVEPQFIIESLVATWQFFWGTVDRPGYFAQLEPEYRRQAYRRAQEGYAVAEMLAALYYSSHLSHTEHWDELRISLRDFWRGFLAALPVQITAETLEAAWRMVGERLPYEPPRPPAIIHALSSLADFETEASFCRALAERFELPRGCCHFESVQVHCRTGPVKCMVLTAPGPLMDQSQALDLLSFWMRYESLDYYRIASPREENVDYLLFYDVLSELGTYWERVKGKADVGFAGPLAPMGSLWTAALEQLLEIAERLDNKLTFPVREASIGGCFDVTCIEQSRFTGEERKNSECHSL